MYQGELCYETLQILAERLLLNTMMFRHSRSHIAHISFFTLHFQNTKRTKAPLEPGLQTRINVFTYSSYTSPTSGLDYKSAGAQLGGILPL